MTNEPFIGYCERSCRLHTLNQEPSHVCVYKPHDSNKVGERMYLSKDPPLVMSTKMAREYILANAIEEIERGCSSMCNGVCCSMSIRIFTLKVKYYWKKLFI